VGRPTGQDGQPNPIVNWIAPLTDDGSQRRELDFPTITTTKVRALIEAGASDGASWLEEIKAYDVTA
jgi:hypothetical protein